MENQQMVNKGIFKKVAMGVLAASVGAVAFGAVHYYFLSGMTGNLFGVPYSTVLPIVIGALGIAGAYMVAKDGIVHDVVLAGAAASIGIGLLSYMNWVTPNSSARARVPAAAAYIPQRAFAPVANASAASAGTKMI
jgi:hypothetical protein